MGTPHTHHEGPACPGPSLWKVLWTSRLCILLFAMFIYSLGFATLVPVLPTLLTNYFAGRHAGHAMQCDEYDVGQQPAACQDAHSDVVIWTSWTSLVSNTFFAFLFSPIVGDMSDTYGRKPFILAGLALATLPITVVFLYLTHGVSLLWYYPCNALSSLVSAIVVFLSYAADVLAPQHRTAGFGLIIAAYSTGFMIGPLIGRLLVPATAAMVAVAGCLASIGVVALAVPESCSPAAAVALPGCPPGPRPPARLRPLDALLSLSRSWALITSSSLFKRLAVCMAIVGVVSEGIQDMLIQYLQLVVGFTTADQGLLFVILGGANLLVQAALLPWLASTLGERRLLLLGLTFSILEQALLALSVTKWQAFAAVSLGSLAGVSFPAISSIKSTHSRADQQGLVQGALAGIRALASGLGPLAFAQLFAACTRATAVFGYQPGIVFWTTCGLTVVAAAVAASIPAHLVKRAGHTETSTAAAAAAAAAAATATCSTAAEGDPLLCVAVLAEDGGDAEATVGLLDATNKAAAAAAAAAAAKSKADKHGRAGVAAAAPAGDLEQETIQDSSAASDQGVAVRMHSEPASVDSALETDVAQAPLLAHQQQQQQTWQQQQEEHQK